MLTSRCVLYACDQPLGTTHRYVLLVDRATPQSEFEGSDIVTLTKVLTVINLDLELVEGTFGPLYQRMSGLDVFEEVVQLYGTVSRCILDSDECSD